MSDGSSVRALPPPSRGGRRAVPPPGSPGGVPLRRRWGLVAIGSLLALLGAWLSMVLVATAGGREETLAMARDVARGERIEREDVRVVRVAADPGVETIGADRLDDLVGRTAGADLPRGALPVLDQFVEPGGRLVGAGEVVVGARLGAAAAPRGEVAPGTPVLVVIRPGPAGGAGGQAGEVRGWVRDMSGPDETTGDRDVSVVVPVGDAALVASAAAEERIAVATLDGGG